MKAKTTTTCTKDGNYPHVSQKSNKISKTPCSMVRVSMRKENIAISRQTSQNDLCKNGESSKDYDNKGDMGQTGPSFSGCTDSMGQTCPSFNGCTDSMGQTCPSFNGCKCSMGQTYPSFNGCICSMGQTYPSFNGCTDSTVVVDSLPPPVSSDLDSNAETLYPYFNWSKYPYYEEVEAVNGEQTTLAPQVDDNNFSDFQLPDVLDSNAYEVCQTGFPSDGITVFDDSQSYNNLSDFILAGTNFINGGTEGNAVFPTVKESIGAENYYHFGGSNGEFQQMPDSSWFNLICHQTIPFTEELHVNSSQLDSNRVNYFDQEAFVRNFLALSDEANSLALPALVSQETSKRKNVTLVLDLDETLVHSTLDQCDGADFTFQMYTDKEYTVSVQKRPFLQEFLEKVSEMFEIIIFTASKRIYAEKLLDVLDPDKKFFSQRVYRESCTWKDRRCVKDLTVLGIDLAKVFIIDNTPEVFRFQVNNGIPIESWYDDPTDSALISLLPFLEKLADVEDVRPLIAEKFGTRN